MYFNFFPQKGWDANLNNGEDPSMEGAPASNFALKYDGGTPFKAGKQLICYELRFYARGKR